jgi:hypothetical protein
LQQQGEEVRVCYTWQERNIKFGNWAKKFIRMSWIKLVWHLFSAPCHSRNAKTVGSIIKHTKANIEVKHSLVCYCEIKTSEVGRIMEYTTTETRQVE